MLRTIDGAGYEQEQAEAVMGLWVIGIGSDGLLEVVCSLGVVAARGEQVGQIVMGFRMIGLQLERLAEELLGRAVVLPGGFDHADQIVGVRIIGLGAQCLLGEIDTAEVQIGISEIGLC